jgi:phosphopantothenoylcysteine decarboxylase/phosphopantothenate--cysteine ligase
MLKYKVLLKITGSIAAYKSAYLASKLVQSGYDVKVVMTESAEKFIGSTTFEAITGNPVYTDMFARREALSHISLMKWADIIVVAPATANTINAFVSGNGDNLVNTLFLAHNFNTPYLIAPAMNTKMFLHPATQNSITILKSWGISILDSDSGYLACGDEGIGKLLDPDKIFDEIEKRLKPKKKNTSVLITSGGTKEKIDDVRFIANMSTGNTGASIADYLITEGYNVSFLHAKDSIKPEANCSFFEFVSFNDLNTKIERLLSQNNYDIVIHLAAVSDYTVTEIKTKNDNYVLPLAKKIKSEDENITLVLYKVILRFSIKWVYSQKRKL